MEILYNNIVLQDDFAENPSDAQNIPYLKEPPEVIDVTVGRQLFVDDFLIENTTLCPEYHKAKKYEGNPILFAETPWEKTESPAACPKSGGVWYDEEEKIFKMWYEAGWLGQICYAVSEDGIHWERPELDIKPGTNIILPCEDNTRQSLTGDIDYYRPDSTTVFIDYNCDKNERYKLFLRNPNTPGILRYPGMIALSADGIHFDRFRFTKEVEDRSTIFYNPFRKKWVYSIKGNWKDRSRNYRECDNLMDGAKWTEEEIHKWLATDVLDRPNAYTCFAPQLYNVDCVGYESIMLGMFEIHHGPENYVCESSGAPKITELIPMYSRDGFHFSRPCRDAVINASMYKGSWDRGYVQCTGGVTIIHGDELWIYYIGFAGDENRAGEFWWTNGMYLNGATGLAKLRRDGFVSMNGTGTLVTRKLQFSGKVSMAVNATGKVKVEILTPDGEVMAVSKWFEGDSTNAALDFGEFDVAVLNGRVFRLCFHVEGKLYSFGFADEKGDFGGAHAAGMVK